MERKKLSPEDSFRMPEWIIDLNMNIYEKSVFCIIAKYTEEEGAYKYTRRYLSEWLGVCSLNTVDKYLKSLIDKEFIIKDKFIFNNQEVPKYRVNIDHPLIRKHLTITK